MKKLKARLKTVLAVFFIVGLVANMAMATTTTKVMSDEGLTIKEVATLVEIRLNEGSHAIFVSPNWEKGYDVSAHFKDYN